MTVINQQLNIYTASQAFGRSFNFLLAGVVSIQLKTLAF